MLKYDGSLYLYTFLDNCASFLPTFLLPVLEPPIPLPTSSVVPVPFETGAMFWSMFQKFQTLRNERSLLRAAAAAFRALSPIHSFPLLLVQLHHAGCVHRMILFLLMLCRLARKIASPIDGSFDFACQYLFLFPPIVSLF